MDYKDGLPVYKIVIDDDCEDCGVHSISLDEFPPRGEFIVTINLMNQTSFDSSIKK